MAVKTLRERQAEATRQLLVSVARQLFADDVVQGFAFIDICQKRFDVVLMNPPFGEPSKPSKSYIEYTYRRTKNDIYAAFVERWLGKLVPGGLLGAITSRTGGTCRRSRVPCSVRRPSTALDSASGSRSPSTPPAP